jgi:preprotein translocase subunit YajC
MRVASSEASAIPRVIENFAFDLIYHKENCLSILHLLADVPTSQPTEAVPFWANPQNMFLILIFGMLMFFVWSSSNTKRKDAKKRDDMLKNMKRGDRVMTAGGILGSVVEVRDSEVLLKVDESTNTKIKFTRDAIKRVVTEDEGSSSAK